MIKGILFDLYGTLFISKNSKKAWKNWLITFYRCLKSYGLKSSKRNFARMCTDFFTKPEPSELHKNLTVYENRIKYFSGSLGLNLKEFEIKETAYTCVNAWHTYLRIDLEVIPLFRKLKNSKKLGLITNFDHPPYIYSILNKYSLIRYFDKIIISGEVGCKKPDPSIFYIILKELNLTPQEVIYVGDSKEDIIGATNAGIRPILIQRKKIIGNDYRVKNTLKFMNIEDLRQYNYTKISNLKEILDFIKS